VAILLLFVQVFTLGIIALFIVLVYGFATIAVTFGNNLKGNLTPLIYFLVFFPVLVFIGFLWLVSQHHDKIYGPADFKDETNFLKMKGGKETFCGLMTDLKTMFMKGRLLRHKD
jgi:cytochrome c biogenesis protein CcdA